MEKKKRASRKKIGKGPAQGLTKNERDLADLTITGFSGKEAAMIVYNPTSPHTATSIASEVLAKPNVRAYLESKAMRAAEIVMDHAENASDMVSLIAARDILDRTGFKTPEPAKDPNQGATYNFLFSKETQDQVGAIEAIIRARLTAAPNAPIHQEGEASYRVVEEGPEEAGAPA